MPRAVPFMGAALTLGVSLVAGGCALLVGDVDGTRSFGPDSGGDTSLRAPDAMDVGARDGADARATDARRADSEAADGGPSQLGDTGVDACAPGSCVPTLVAGSQPDPLDVLVVHPSDENLYWVGALGQVFFRAPGAAPFALPGLKNVLNIAVDDVNVYWTAHTVLGSSLRDGGGAPTTLVTNETLVRSVAVDATYLYWADVMKNAFYRIPKTGLDGGVDDAGIGVLGPGSPLNAPQYVAVDSTNAYVVSYDGVLSVSLASLNATRLPETTVDPQMPLVGAGTGLLWYLGSPTSDGGTLQRYDPLSLEATTIVTASAISAFATDDLHVYWTEDVPSSTSAVGSVHRAAIDGSEQVVLASSQLHPTGIAVGNTHVFWAASEAGQGTSAIYSVPK